MTEPLSSAAKTIYPFYLSVHSLKNQTQQLCDEKPHGHIATTLAKRDMAGLSISPDSPELVLPASWAFGNRAVLIFETSGLYRSCSARSGLSIGVNQTPILAVAVAAE